MQFAPTPSGYVLTRPDALEALREEASRTPTHRTFLDAAITAIEHNGPDDADPLLHGCSQQIAGMILAEAAEAYEPADRVERAAHSNTTVVRDFQQPYTSHRQAAARRADRARSLREATGINRLRIRLTIG
ncbi:hypothetical protein ACFV1U_14560 [Streptomyces microflavus]|uniref:hypothetical protein n=1 Tax=Streptomyces microflavus TaxID=1919 RepID=UPI00369FECF0